MTHGHGLLHYMGLFTLYTLLAIGAIYALYWYLRKTGGVGALAFGKKGAGTAPLEVESMMTLEARKNLYVIKSGTERFLIATSMEGTQLLSKLEATAGQPEAATVAVMAPPAPECVVLPFEDPNPPVSEPKTASKPASLTPCEPDLGFSGRLMHSLRWLASSRVNLGRIK